MIMEGFKGPSEVIDAENQVKIKQKHPHSADIPVIYCFILKGLRAQLILWQPSMLFPTLDRMPEITLE